MTPDTGTSDTRDRLFGRREVQRPGSGFYRHEPRFLQELERGPWHVESLEDVEYMLCDVFISVESSAKINHRWGLKKCPWCLKELQRVAPNHPMAQE